MFKVVFTDIDGTLIDIFTREYGNTIQLVKKLQKDGIPVVLCSSKTLEEQAKIIEDIGINGKQPFIIENGAAIIIPKNYFNYGELIEQLNLQNLEHKLIDELNEYVVIELGQPRQFVLTILNEIRKNSGIKFKGVSDLSVDQLSKIVQMPADDASRMAMRRYGETIVNIDRSDVPLLKLAVEARGFKMIHGGRYLDITSGVDKGKAVDILKAMFQKKIAKEYGVSRKNNKAVVIFFGIGDSRNDIPMLQHVGIPILVQSYDGSWSSDVLTAVPQIIKVKGVGPKGWESAYKIIMRDDPLDENLNPLD
jgi:mannosyl-3-phosphoglycerate phosphatase family protein